MFSVYEVKARLVPALICSVPFLAFGYFFLAGIDAAFTQIVLAQAIGGVGMMAAMFLFLAFVARYVGTWLQDVMFKDGSRFPTTVYLLDQDNTFSGERKRQIRSRVKEEFGVDISSHIADTVQSRQRIGEAVSHIRKKFFGKPGLALQRNIEFGIAKNIAGGSIIALTVCLMMVSIGLMANLTTAIYFGLIAAPIYILLIAFGLLAMKANARRYATALFEEYLAS